jgi:hypothetical protein
MVNKGGSGRDLLHMPNGKGFTSSAWMQKHA